MDSCLYAKYEEKVRPFIDLIDSLRSLGVDKDLSLPAIAVIGDQSSGKSSVLEALSGVTLPRGSGIVTRCPLELKLVTAKKGSEWKGKISYLAISRDLLDPMEVEEAIMEAQDAIAGPGEGISSELISLAVISPNVPNLTLIDLPGIARVAVGGQPKDIGDQIKELIRKYIDRQETICLVVVPCNVDIATTEALEMARQVDLNGERTLGILTKPDMIDLGAERQVVEILKNETVHLNKGYMIVKCRGQREIQERLSLNDALEREKYFFEVHDHFSDFLKKKKASVPCLAQRLTTELVEHIRKSLPSLEHQLKQKLQKTNDELEKCGQIVPDDEQERFTFLLDMINQFNQDIVSVTQGEEENPKLYAKLRDSYSDWQTKLDGCYDYTTRKDEVEEFVKLQRGRELPPFINYKTFEAIVKKEIGSMQDPATEVLKAVTGEDVPAYYGI
ncbi:interferon-induced GTP-binding protein Mx-like [Pseudophryne corroboree]|uniref:interferon-induced GTP-binding protein Mx-like n=1 Tax=Pseudophryne corroboree TaxID=495146 RepID=UPI003081725F